MQGLSQDIIEFLDQSNAIEGVGSEGLDDSVKAWLYITQKHELTRANILQTHKILMKNQPLEFAKKGAWRKEAVYIGGREAKPWYAVPDLMDGWIVAVNNSLTSKYVETKEQKEGLVVAMHIAFEDIHPFVDGNGRMGRILMNWKLRYWGLPVKIIREEDKFEYYKWFKDLK